MEDQNDLFKEIFKKSPIGILFYDKEGKLIDANQSALKIARVSKFEDIRRISLFVNPNIESRKEELLKNGIIRFQSSRDLDTAKEYGFYTPTESGIICIDYTISRINSGFLMQIQDITEQKQMQNSLQENEKKFRVALRNSPTAVFQQDLNLRYTWVYQPHSHFSEENLIGYTDWDVLDSKDAERITKIKKRVLSEKIPLQEEVSIYVNGKKFYYVLSLEPLFDIEGNIIGLSGASTDITEGRKSEKKLKYQANLLNNVNDPIIATDLNLVITSWNKAAEKIYGYNANEAIGKLVSDVIKSDFSDKKRKMALETLSNGQECLLEVKQYNKDHKPIYIEATTLPVYSDGKITGYVAVNHDVTRRKKAEDELKQAHNNLEKIVQKRTYELKNTYESLKENEEKFRLIFDEAEDSIVLNEINEDGTPGKIIEANEATTKRLGYTKEELLNMYPSEVVAPECHTEIPKNAEKLKKEGHVIFEIIHNAKDGRKIPVEVNNHLIEFKGKKTALTIVRDITQRKEMEKQLKETIEELERSNKELQSFAYITSHDLQEPLRTMSSYAGLLKRRYGGQLDSDADDFLDYMIKGAFRMKDMIQGLLDYSRVGTQREECTEFNSEEALDNALTNLKSSIEECNAEITHDDLPTIIADREQISRIFQNLIGNALKFRKEDKSPKIYISARKEDNEYVFSVSDNGIGIEEPYTGRIFEVFKRLHAIDEYQGAGIGLAIVKRIIDNYHGRIWVESSPGKGSTFYFTLKNNS